MTDNNLNMFLKDEAEKIGFCTKFHGYWKDEMSREELIELYKCGIEFCIDHDFPKKEFIKKHFDRNLLLLNGVYVDESELDDILRSGIYVFNGECNGTIKTMDFSVVTMYLRHDTELEIQTGHFSKVFVHTYDNATVNVTKGLNSSAYIYKHHEKKPE